MILLPQQMRGGKIYGYVRVSTKKQKLRMQLDALAPLNCVKIFKDHGVSGAKAKRPGLDQALATLKPHDVLVVYKLDRLGRSVAHLANLITELNKRNVQFCSLTEGIDTTTPGGKLIFHVFSAVAEFQRDIIRENTLHGLETARNAGKVLGRPRALDDEILRVAHELVTLDHIPVNDVAGQFDVNRTTLTRGFARLGLPLAA